MERTTITIPDELRSRLRRLAAERGVSMATIVREAIDEKLNRWWPPPRSLGAGSSGRSRHGSEIRRRAPRAALVALILERARCTRRSTGATTTMPAAGA